MRILIPLILIVGGIGTLIAMGIIQQGIPEVQVSQLLTGDYATTKIKVHGVIASIKSDARPLVFTISDKVSKETILKVEVDDVRPDLFKIGNDVAVEGYYDAGLGRLDGTRIYTKCPSKYEASKQAPVETADGGAYGAPESKDQEPEKPESPE